MQQLIKFIRVVGPPRSGTNLSKYLIDTSTDVKGIFDLGWWKHALPNPLVFKDEKNRPFPTIIMFREAKSQLTSLYKLSLKGANAFIGNNDPKQFIDSPVLMRLPDRSLEFFFPSPIDYLIQYYHAMLSWDEPNNFFIKLEDLIEKPQIIYELMKNICPNCQINSTPILPSEYLARNPDKKFSRDNCFDLSTTVFLEKNISETLSKKLSFESKKWGKLEKIYLALLESKKRLK